MKIYRLISNIKLHGFNDPIGEVIIIDKSLNTCQKAYCQQQGLDLIDVTNPNQIKEESYILFQEDCYFTIDFLKQILMASKEATTNLEFVLAPNEFNDRFILPIDENTNKRKTGFRLVKDRNEQFEDYVVKQSLYHFETKIPTQLIKSRRFAVPQCKTFATRIISPFHLLQVNMAENLKRTIRLQNGFFANRLKNIRGRLGSRLFYKGLKRLNRIGKNCLIHPTAIIEGSEIGDNVKIGAGAIVRLSQLGDNVTISDNVVVANSVLGHSTFVSNSNYLEMVMTYEEAFLIHGPYQFSIFGRNSAAFAVINCDFRMDQESIKIPTSHGIIDSKQPFLGIAYGHHSKVAGGNIIAAGRIVPNETIINPPDNIILKF